MKNPSFLILASLSSLILVTGCTQKRIAEEPVSTRQNTPTAAVTQAITPVPAQSPVDTQTQQTPLLASESTQTVTETFPDNASPAVTVLLFGFNKRELTPQMKEVLDQLATELVDQNIENITIDGHTDHLEGGGNSGNIQKTSEVRANLVKDYLTRKKVPEQLINAQGKGRGQPKTQEGECKGTLSRQTLICLQPDRRVEILIFRK